MKITGEFEKSYFRNVKISEPKKVRNSSQFHSCQARFLGIKKSLSFLRLDFFVPTILSEFRHRACSIVVIGGSVPTLRSEFRHAALQRRRKRDYRYFSINSIILARFRFFNFFSKAIDSALLFFESANFKTHGLNDFVETT